MSKRDADTDGLHSVIVNVIKRIVSVPETYS